MRSKSPSPLPVFINLRHVMTVGPDCLINFASAPTPNKGQRYCTKQKSLFCKYDCIVTFQLERKKMYKCTLNIFLYL